MNDNWIERNTTLVLSAIGLLIFGLLLIILLRWRPAERIAIIPPEPTATPGPIEVYVSGAVANPAVVELAPDARVEDALTAAGGTTTDADLDRINLAQPVEDGQQVFIPTEADETVDDPNPGVSDGPDDEPAAQDGAPTGPININTANQEELEALPGIGPSLAERIIAYREENGPFETIEEIQDVSGIGPSIFDELAPLITVE
ncbi:MAG: ComEA family DNA-binding protein [Chloroflexi bacterium]|nr:ComEA family DNA-binding protein [Chloroflexota bacterium]